MRGTVADVDLDAIAHNFAAIKRAGRGDVIAVVKADAYGHGSEAIARTLRDAGAAMFAVSTFEEAVVVQREVSDAELLVLLDADGREETDAAIDAGFRLVVWEVGRAREIAEAARAKRTTARVHFKVDTGLTRLGAPWQEALARYRAIHEIDGIEIEGVFSHLANAGESDDRFSPIQAERFRSFVAEIGAPPRFVHLSGSGGLESLGALPYCTAVRPGLALYGLHPVPDAAGALPLRPALAWRTVVRRAERVAPGTGVSYGHAFRAGRETRIATVPLGYADGLSRMAGGRLWLLAGGVPVPIVGRVCMDLCMLDVGERSVAVGDEVVIIGEQHGARQTAEDVAAVCGTISYEIVTNLHARVPRRYLRGGQVVATKTLAGGFAWR